MIRTPLARLALLAVAMATLSPATVGATGPIIRQHPNLTQHVPALELEMIRPHRTCKAAAHTAQSTVSAADARNRWADQARSLHGTSWGAWTVAANRDETVVQGLANRTYYASARPCRSLLITP
jgi:hypothetical protein